MKQKDYNKNNPKNVEQAYAFQLEDDIKHLHSLALLHLSGSNEYNNQLKKIENRITSYREHKIRS